MLAFVQHNSEKTFNYKQIGAAMELNTDGERLELIEVLEALKQQGFVKEAEAGKFQIKSSKIQSFRPNLSLYMQTSPIQW